MSILIFKNVILGAQGPLYLSLFESLYGTNRFDVCECSPKNIVILKRYNAMPVCHTGAYLVNHLDFAKFHKLSSFLQSFFPTKSSKKVATIK
jgi:hypothetical protein